MSRRMLFGWMALGIFGIEVLIATQLRSHRFIRGSLGDFLVVILVYCAVKALWPIAPRRLGPGVFLFATAIELGQYVHLADWLGFARGSIASIVLGNSFSVEDLAMYFLGTLTAIQLDQWLTQKGWVR